MRTLLVVLALLAVPSTAQASQLVSYSRTGGLTGLSSTLTVARDRHAHLVDNRGDHQFTLSTKRFRALRSALRAAHFASLAKVYRPDGIVSDGVDETVRFQHHGVTVSTGGKPPRRLVHALDKLRALTQ